MRIQTLAFVVSLSVFSSGLALSAEPVNTVCPISGKPVDRSITYDYEGRTYAFAMDACRTKFIAAREASLYHQIGGQAAVNAAVDLFYKKVLADERVNFFFDDVNMERQHNKQKSFIAAALGSPVPYEGKDMRSAHKHLPGLNDTHFDAIGGHLKATLEELKVKPELVAKVLAVVETTRNDVLNRPVAGKP
jgi:hemoglobin